MNYPIAHELIDGMMQQVAYFEMTLRTCDNKLLEPELDVSRRIVRRFQSKRFDANQIVDEINSLDRHYDGYGWWCFLHCVAEYLSLAGKAWEVQMWCYYDPELNFANVIFPAMAEVEVKCLGKPALLHHLGEGLLPQFQRLAALHQRFEEAYLVALEILAQLRDQDVSYTKQSDIALCRLGGAPLSKQFLDCATEYATRAGLD